MHCEDMLDFHVITYEASFVWILTILDEWIHQMSPKLPQILNFV